MEKLRDLDTLIKCRLGATFVSIIVSHGDTAFLSIWKNPLLENRENEHLTSMKHLPLFYVICYINEHKNLALKLITHHGKILRTLDPLEHDTKENQDGVPVSEEEKLKFVEQLNTLKMCRGIGQLGDINVPHLTEQLEQTLIIRSQVCSFALFDDNATCDACQNLYKNNNSGPRTEICSKVSRASRSRRKVTGLDSTYCDSLNVENTIHMEGNISMESDSVELPDNVLMEWSTNQEKDVISINEISILPDTDVAVNETKCKTSQPNEYNKLSLNTFEECDRPSNEKLALDGNVRTNDKTHKSFHCRQCQKVFFSRSNLSKHHREHHQEPDEARDINLKNNKGYECQSCDFKTSRRTGLTDHINAVHDKLKLYMCQHCSHTFASNGNLTQHIQAVHEKLRPFICQYCTYATSSQPNLRKHIKAVHHKIRDFKCSICPFDAASKQLLVRHVQAVHEKIKAYKCKYCQYECAKGYNMKVHIRHVHEKQKGYKCDQCSFESTRRGKLTEHQISCHGISVSNQASCDGETPEAETIIVQSAIETRSILVE